MSDVFYLRPMEPPVSPADVVAMRDDAGGCFDLHRVEWVRSVLADDGATMLCWYRAPDAESVRVALRSLGASMSAVWPGRVHRSSAVLEEARSLVELDLSGLGDLPLERLMGQVAALETGLNLVLGIELGSGDKGICLSDSADRSRVRSVFERAGISPAAVWSCQVLRPPGAGD